jgi:hypothetical protein
MRSLELPRSRYDDDGFVLMAGRGAGSRVDTIFTKKIIPKEDHSRNMGT